MSISSESFRDLTSLSNLRANQEPSLFMGRLSDPTSWLESFCCCCRISDPEIVNQYLQSMIGNVSDALKNDAKVDINKYEVIQGAKTSLDRLASEEGAKTVRLGSEAFREKARKSSSQFADMKRDLENNAKINASCSAWAHGRVGRVKRD